MKTETNFISHVTTALLSLSNCTGIRSVKDRAVHSCRALTLQHMELYTQVR